jgi:hypothetical protein
MVMINFETVTLKDAEQAIRCYNEGFYAKAGLKNIAVDKRARDTFADGLGSTLERLTSQLRFIGKDYGGVAGFPSAISLAPAIGRDIYAHREAYQNAVAGAAPLRDAVPSRETLGVLYAPFVKELHGKRNWLTWATKFWHFLNVEAFPMEDSTVDKFFKLHNQTVSLDKYENLLQRYRSFADSHRDWLPNLRRIDGGQSWSDVKLWDKVCYGIADMNKANAEEH